MNKTNASVHERLFFVPFTEVQRILAGGHLPIHEYPLPNIICQMRKSLREAIAGGHFVLFGDEKQRIYGV